ncbi:MAG: fluoride efflux transporter CrcB [Acidimicrobiales bacterium]|nr:fluoride efflux transporter CrcB [Acidimicrobiales bacterium]
MALTGGVGAISRYGMDKAISSKAINRSTFPWGTFLVNSLGSLLLGAITALHVSGKLNSDLATLFGTGFCGSFTTFSTYMYESFKLIEEGSWAEGLKNILGTAVFCAGFGAIGLILGSI